MLAEYTTEILLYLHTLPIYLNQMLTHRVFEVFNACPMSRWEAPFSLSHNTWTTYWGLPLGIMCVEFDTLNLNGLYKVTELIVLYPL